MCIIFLCGFSVFFSLWVFSIFSLWFFRIFFAEGLGDEVLVKRLSSRILSGFSMVSQVGCGSFAKLATILSQNKYYC